MFAYKPIHARRRASCTMRARMTQTDVGRNEHSAVDGEILGLGQSTRVLVMTAAEFWRACQPWSDQTFVVLKATNGMLCPREVTHASAFDVVVLERCAVLALEHWSMSALVHTQEPHKIRVLFTGGLRSRDAACGASHAAVCAKSDTLVRNICAASVCKKSSISRACLRLCKTI